MKKYCCLIAASALLALPVFAQTIADEIETLLDTSAVTYAQAASFVLQVSEVPVSADQAAANRWFEYAAQQQWLPKNAAANDTARLDGVSLLVMRSFDMKGGIFYTLFKNSRYAYRELAYQGIIQGRIDSAMPVSGDTLLYIINKLLEQEDGEQ